MLFSKTYKCFLVKTSNHIELSLLPICCVSFLPDVSNSRTLYHMKPLHISHTQLCIQPTTFGLYSIALRKRSSCVCASSQCSLFRYFWCVSSVLMSEDSLCWESVHRKESHKNGGVQAREKAGEEKEKQKGGERESARARGRFDKNDTKAEVKTSEGDSCR